VGATWPEAVASPDSKTKQMKKRVLDIIKNLKLKKSERISEHTRRVHQIFQRKPSTW
jgi:predicted metal-dependent TIM-barrel fold hydrolase